MAVSVSLNGGPFAGGFVIAWETASGVFFQRFNPSHEPVGSPTMVTGASAAWVSATPLGDGTFSVIWDPSGSSSPVAQDYDASGSPVGSPHSDDATAPALNAFTTVTTVAIQTGTYHNEI